MTKHTFNLDGGITSLVMSPEEFEECLARITHLVPESSLQAMRQARHIPAIMRGTKTKFLFDIYGVDTPKMGIIVRGEGPAILQNLLQGQSN